MDAIDRVMKSLNHEEPDRVPSYEIEVDNYDVCNHFGEEYIYEGLVKWIVDAYEIVKGDTDALTNTMLRATQTRYFLQKQCFQKHFGIFAKIGIDLVSSVLTGGLTMPIHYGKDYYIDELGKIFDLKQNPSDGMDLMYYRGGLYKNFEEYEEGIKPDPDNRRRERYFKAFKQNQNEYKGKVYAAPVVGGPFSDVWMCFGFTNFTKLLRRPSEAKKVFDERGKFFVEVVKRFIEWGESNLLIIFDDFGFKSGLMISPKHYQMYVIPWIKEMCKISHKAGLKVILHSCGEISKIFEDLMNAGIDAFHPIEPTTANPDYDIFKLNEKYGDKITLIGNVSPQALATESPEFIRNYSKKLIKEVAPGGGYIFSSGHSINPEVTLENFLAMRDTLKKYGKYPINMS